MNARRWIKFYILIFALSTLSAFFINYKIDDFAVFRSDYHHLHQEPNQNFIKMKFLLTKKHHYDSFIFGSSRVGKIMPYNIPNGHYYNMTYSEGLPLEHLSNIKLLIQKGIPIKNVMIGLDDFSYEVDPAKHLQQLLRKPHYETDLGKETPLEFYFDYLLIRPSFSDLSRVVNEKFFHKKYAGYDYDIFGSGVPVIPTEVEERIEKNPLKHMHDSKFLKPDSYRGNRIEETIETLKAIVQLSKTYHFNLIIFINPIHKTTYLDTDFENFQTFKKRLAGITDYYDFSGLNSVTENNYFYFETSHYRPIVGEFIKSRIFGDANCTCPDDFGVLVTHENIDRHLEDLEKQLKSSKQ